MFKTNKESLTVKEIEEYINEFEAAEQKRYNKLWQYFMGKNTGIITKPAAKEGNPDNHTKTPYGRKIITTFTGYAYRPKYITFEQGTAEKKYFDELKKVFDYNKEWIKTSRSGRNTGIFGVAYEMFYIGAKAKTEKDVLSVDAVPRFFNADPREIILLYDYQPEPEKKIGIRYYQIGAKDHMVEVYYPDRFEIYRRTLGNNGKYEYSLDSSGPNFFMEVPIVEYELGDEKLGLIEPVLDYIDDYDLLVSDSFIEFSRFANAYLRIVGMGIFDTTGNAKGLKSVMQRIKEFRVFNNLTKPEDVTFLTKDIPTSFITFMTQEVKKQIHVQSHVPDFNELASGALSGAAIQRLLFDFENVCSDAEADFDIGLYDRIRLINTIFKAQQKEVSEGIIIQHKRNIPLNLKEFADTALTMKNAGFSRYLIASIMPDDIVPDVEEELARQDEDMEKIMPDSSEYQEEPNGEEDYGEREEDSSGEGTKGSV